MAETVTARAADQHFSRLLRGVAEGESFVITHRGRPVARLVPEPAPEAGRRLTPEQEQALAESVARARAEAPGRAADRPPRRPAAQPRRTLRRDAARAVGRPMSGTPRVAFDSNVLVHAAQAGDPRQEAALGPLQLAAGGRCVLTPQAFGGFPFAATRKGLAPRPEAAAQVQRWLTAFPSPLAAWATAVVAATDAVA